MRHLRNINENFGGESSFTDTIDRDMIVVDNPPARFEEEKAEIRWRLQLKSNRGGVEMITIIVDRVLLYGDVFGDSDTNQPDVYEIEEIDTDKQNISDSIYPTAMQVDMNGSWDISDWTVNVRFGNPL